MVTNNTTILEALSGCQTAACFAKRRQEEVTSVHRQIPQSSNRVDAYILWERLFDIVNLYKARRQTLCLRLPLPGSLGLVEYYRVISSPELPVRLSVTPPSELVSQEERLMQVSVNIDPSFVGFRDPRDPRMFRPAVQGSIRWQQHYTIAFSGWPDQIQVHLGAILPQPPPTELKTLVPLILNNFPILFKMHLQRE